MRKTLSRFSPTGGSKKSAEEAEKRARQLRERNEENAIMQEVCQDIGGRLAGTVNIMEALQEEIEIRTSSLIERAPAPSPLSMSWAKLLSCAAILATLSRAGSRPSFHKTPPRNFPTPCLQQ